MLFSDGAAVCPAVCTEPPTALPAPPKVLARLAAQGSRAAQAPSRGNFDRRERPKRQLSALTADTVAIGPALPDLGCDYFLQRRSRVSERMFTLALRVLAGDP
jgi:hypothetical protein